LNSLSLPILESLCVGLSRQSNLNDSGTRPNAADISPFPGAVKCSSLRLLFCVFFLFPPLWFGGQQIFSLKPNPPYLPDLVAVRCFPSHWPQKRFLLVEVGPFLSFDLYAWYLLPFLLAFETVKRTTLFFSVPIVSPEIMIRSCPLFFYTQFACECPTTLNVPR